jgi:hypothetical protein
MRIALIHSPLVGPATWRGVAVALASLGHEVELPDLREAARSGDPQQFVRTARSAISERSQVLVGHSGAGFFLPPIAAGLERPARLVFVDAAIPPADGTATASADFLDQLRAMAVDGILPIWSRWWGEDAVARLIPDGELRSEVEGELIQVPLSFYEAPVAFPPGWRATPSGFVLLSEGYRAAATTAASLGWPSTEHLGAHLDLVNHPDLIAEAIASMVTLRSFGS